MSQAFYFLSVGYTIQNNNKTNNAAVTLTYTPLDIPFKTIIKPTSCLLSHSSHKLDIPFKTIIKPTLQKDKDGI